MSTPIGESPGGVILTQLWSGEWRGMVIQVGDELQLMPDEAKWIGEKLVEWAKQRAEVDHDE